MEHRRDFTGLQAALTAALAAVATVGGAPRIAPTIEEVARVDRPEDASPEVVLGSVVNYHDDLATHEAALRNERRKATRRHLVALGADEDAEKPDFTALDTDLESLADAGATLHDAIVAWWVAPEDG